jgi:dipeptidase E
MAKYILFSNQQNNDNIQTILDEIFPEYIRKKRAAFMPSQGLKLTKQKYIDEWKNWATKYEADFFLLDNACEGCEGWEDYKEEHQKLHDSNILIISGGNTYQLLLNLRQSGFDKEILKFCHRPDVIVAGYSAGAIVLSPTIEITNARHSCPEEYQFMDFKGLRCFEFEIFPHYSPEKHEILQAYQEIAKFPVKTITDNDYIVIDKKRKKVKTS